MLRCAVVCAVLIACLGACRSGPPPAEEGETLYVVQPGDTLSEIADRHSTPLSLLARRNELERIDQIEVGRTLIIPRVRFAPLPVTPDPAPSDELPPLPKSRTEPPQPIVEDPDASLPSAPEAGSAPFIWPVDGVVTMLFGRFEGTHNDGIEIGAPIGTVVWAAAAGEVLFSGEQAGYGKLVIVLHDDAVVTLYAHNSKNIVKEGDRVKQGQAIALVGQTGGAVSPGLHFELRADKKPINPLARLPR